MEKQLPRHYYSVKDVATGNRSVQFLDVREVATIRKSRGPSVEFVRIDSVFNDAKSFAAMFDIYGNCLIQNTTEKFTKILLMSYESYGLPDYLADYVSNYGAMEYFSKIDEKLYEKIRFNKRTFISLVGNAAIDDRQKGIFFKQLRRIPIMKEDIVKKIKASAFFVIFFVSSGSLMGYMLLDKVVPRLLNINKNIDVDLSTSWAILIFMMGLTAVGLTAYQMFGKYRDKYLEFFLNFRLTARIVRKVSTVDLLAVYLIGLFSNAQTTEAIYNETFPWMKQTDIGNVATLVNRIASNPQHNKFFDMSGLVVLDNVAQKSSEEVVSTVREQSEGYAATLVDDIDALNKITK